MHPAQTDSRATMVRMILLACPFIPEPVGSEPVGSEPVGSEPVGSEPVGSFSVTDSTKEIEYIMYVVGHCMHACAKIVQSE